MSSTLTIDGPCRRTLAFSIERAAVEAVIEERVAALAQRSRFKGFRPGHAPVALIRKTYGKEAAEDARRQLMNRAFQEAIREHKLQPVGDPELNLQALNDDGQGPFTFELTIEVAPDFELDDLDKLPVSIALPEITDAMVEREVERLRQQAGRIEDAPEGAAVGPEAVLATTIVYTVDGTALEPRPDRPVLLKHDIVDGFVIPGAGAAFTGKHVGDRVELEADLPAHFQPAELAGRRAALAATIDRHRVIVVPELNEELLARAGVKTADELRQKVREQLGLQRERAREETVDRAVEGLLVERHKFELPERLLAKAIDRRVHERAHQLMEHQGLDAEAGHQQAEADREQIAQATRRALHASFILARIARENNLGATLQEAEEQIAMLARSQNQEPKELLANARQEGWIQDIAAQITEQKTREWLRARSVVTETAPPPQEPEGASRA
jgi:trigger factor